MKLKLQGADEVIVSNGGLALASAIMKSLRTGRRLNRIRLGSESRRYPTKTCYAPISIC